MRPVTFLLFFFIAGSCAAGQESASRSTTEERAALFDELIEKTRGREAFSPIKNQLLGFDPIDEMMKYRQEMIDADNDEKLFNVLVKISNARKDAHLRVDPVERLHAPLRFMVDYTRPDKHFLFVADYSKYIAEDTGGVVPRIGDKLVSVNGAPISDYFKQVEPYLRYSTVNGLWWKFAEAIPIRTFRIPVNLEAESFVCELENADGERYELNLPYLNKDAIAWEGFYKDYGDDRYPDFSLLYSTDSYKLYINELEKEILLLVWRLFGENLVNDVDRLMSYASDNGLLDHQVIFDGTRSGGGLNSGYLIRRLTSKPFKTTFGNLKISDVTEEFIRRKKSQYARRRSDNYGTKGTTDDGTWLIDWLDSDVRRAIERNQAYSNNVPHKLAHLPKDSDGTRQPADVHFSGSLVCFFGPYGGSQLDQFAAQVIDNDLCHSVGMPTAGYSNTWEWSETLTFPGTRKPAPRFMWSIGHTIRPNGEILEGNPALPDEYIPITRENYLDYYDVLLSSAYQYFKESKGEKLTGQ